MDLKLPHFIVPLLVLGQLTIACKTSQQIREKPQVGEKTWQTDLSRSFRTYYGQAIRNHASLIENKYPIVIQEFGGLYLSCSDGQKDTFRMKPDAYMTLAHTSHPPLSLYSILSLTDFQLTDSTLSRIQQLKALNEAANAGIQQVGYLTPSQRERSRKILALTVEYISQLERDKRSSRGDFAAFGKKLQPLYQENLYDAAKILLEQFREQMYQWKKTYPKENWAELRVGIVGLHQPRALYAQKLFFQWLLKEPELEKRVVYAEFQMSRKPLSNSELAFKQLVNVDFEKELALFLLGDEDGLQEDVTGPYAQKILESWGESDWFD